MNLTKTSINRPVSVFIIILALLVFGMSTIVTAPVELMPNMVMPMMLVVTPCGSLGPEDTAELVTKVIENAASTMQGLENIYSQSNEGQSLVQINMEYGSDMNLVHTDLQKKIDMYKQFLPEEAQTPIIIEMSTDNMMDTITLAAKAKGDVDLLYYVEEEIKPEFEKVSGVAQVSVTGGQKDYVSVTLDAQAMQQYGLDINTLVQYISVADFTYPAGNVSKGSTELGLRGGVKYDTAEKLRSLPITLPTGAMISLSDVATVHNAKEERNSISRYNGSDTVNIGVMKRNSAPTVETCRNVKKAMNAINEEDKGVELIVVNDTSKLILMAVRTVIVTLLLGILISMVVLYLFFGDMRASFIVGSAMPISVLTTLIIMDWAGFTFNIMSLGGLVIGVGMMVDNSIVVLESCFREKENSATIKDAVIMGTHNVTASIIASTLTTVVVFLPMSVMQGMTGQLFKQLGFTIIFSLTASLISAVTVVPLVFLRINPKEKKDIKLNKYLDKVKDRYGEFLRKTFRHKKAVVGVSVGLLVLSIACLAFIDTELMPSIDQGMVRINAAIRPGLLVDKGNEIAEELENMVTACDDVENYNVNITKNGINIMAFLDDDRKLETYEVVDMWREATKDTVGYTVSVNTISIADMMSMGGGVQVNLQSTDLDQLKEGVEIVENELLKSDSFIKVSSDLDGETPQAELIIDPVKSQAQGLMPAMVVSTVSSNINGKKAATMHSEGRNYDIKLEYPKGTYDEISDLSEMMLLSPMGRQVPLMEIAEIKYSNAPKTIMKKDNQYLATITAVPTSKAKAAANGEVVSIMNTVELPQGVSISGGIEIEAMMKEFKAMIGAILTAVFLVFMVMAMQFESTRFSLVVMVCIPFSLIGSFGLLALTGVTMSMVSLMGFLMLVGIVINNGILFIDTAGELRKSMDAETALVYAGKIRLRPILMTTLTTVLSMVPLAFKIGSGSEIMQGMAIVIIGGLVASTILTLLLLPTFYLLMNTTREERQDKRRLRREKRRLKKEGKQDEIAELAADDSLKNNRPYEAKNDHNEDIEHESSRAGIYDMDYDDSLDISLPEEKSMEEDDYEEGSRDEDKKD